MGCSRHPDAAVHRGFCAACLFEEALAPEEPAAAPIPSFTIQVPLGEGPSGVVFLVRTHEPAGGLLRLKTSRSNAPEAFVERFLALPPASVRAAKRLSARAFDLELDAFRAEMEAAFEACLASDEHRQAMEAIRARRR